MKVYTNATRNIYVNISFPMLCDARYVERSAQLGLNPEIYFEAATLDRYSESDYQSVAEQLHRHQIGVTFHGPFIDMAAGSPDSKIREAVRHRFEQLLKVVSIFKPKTVVCHAGYDRKHCSFYRERWVENALDTWTWFAKQLNEEGCRLMLENVFEDAPSDIRILFENLQPHRVGWCLDIGHQTVFSSASLEEWLEGLGDFMGQMHLHDNFGKNDDHLALGAGTINFKPLFEFLKSKPEDQFPVITIEPHEEKHLLPSIEYLKTHLADRNL